MSEVGLVLAAGRGQRLAPLTDARAKPALPFLGRPVLAGALDALLRAGVGTIAVNAWHLPDQVEAAALAWRSALTPPRPEVIVVRERELLGTGGGARGLWEALGRPAGPVPLLNGDIVTDVDLAPHLARHAALGAAATLLVSDRGEGRVGLDARGERVTMLPGHAGPVRAAPVAAEVSYVGAALLEPDALLELPSGAGCLLRDGLVKRLLAAGAVAASMSTARHADVGTPERYFAALREILGEGVPAERDGSWLGEAVTRDDPVWIHPDATVGQGARLGPYVVLDAGAHVAACAHVHHALVAEGEAKDQIAWVLQIGAAALPVVRGS